ncbi:unnamed protein product [Ambrosiozyma monospora]|uniref:Unnamed protein product n=1 Tax=Ambrosiozyma monospora TaxID=43982 RepID=A0ACB5T828_AMBMO|nr:unnamed protein product [Ambrosiozyma monospora]
MWTNYVRGPVAQVDQVDQVDNLKPDSESFAKDGDEINLNTNTGSYITHDKSLWDDDIDRIDVDIGEIMKGLHLKDHEFCYEVGCTVTVCDIEPAGYRLERISMYDEGAFDLYEKMNKSKLITRGEFTEKLVRSQNNLERMLDTTPDWSKIRWVNVNGLEKFSLKLILQKFGVDLNHLETQLGISRLAPDDVTFISGGTSEDQLIFQLESLKGDMKHTFQECQPGYYTMRSQIRSIFSKNGDNYEKTEDNISEFPEIPFLMLSEQLEQAASVNAIQLGDRYNNQNVVFVQKDLGTFILLRETNTVISFFEHSGERIEEEIVLRFMEALTENRTINTTISSFYQFLTLEFTKEYSFVLQCYIAKVYALRTSFFTNLSETASVMDLQKLNFLAEEIRDLQAYLSQAYSSLQESHDTLSPPDATGSGQKDIQEMEVAKIEQFKLQLEETDRLLQSIDGLVNLGFNRISAGSDRAMSMLSYISLVFLPASFWTSYYGMNLQELLKDGASVWEFWVVAVLFTIVLVMLVLYLSWFGVIRKSWLRVFSFE